MTTNQIRYLIMVANEKSINRAAKKLFISQSALSNAIKSVEEEFGRQIFNRGANGVTLTPFGRQFIGYIVPLNRQLMLLYAMKNPGDLDDVPHLRIISNGFFYLSGIASAIGTAAGRSGIRIQLKEDYSGNITEALREGHSDIGIVRIWSCYKSNTLEQYSAMNLTFHPIAKMQVGVNLGEANPLFRSCRSDSIAPSRLEGFPQILDESLDNGPYSDILYRLKLPKSSFRYVVNSRAAIYELLGLTSGYSIDSRAKAGVYTSPGAVYRFIPLRDCSVTSEIGWVARTRASIPPEAHEFIRLLRDYLTGSSGLPESEGGSSCGTPS